ncbi:acyltransferase [Mucilaginibacter sp. AK015]|uniref:acyltransferase family protein n=1 Tax=Mucilaginibacter sp. AK015 TaxID=2723072 RepID=UPI0016189FC9|nr:acyltransferase [Mucilaginibacter sp. AK015]MBB5395639.1 peptidoglycan/LPS O-acetylase OafA/YrhL [Mucilaginibacter sp. AK015]
MNKVWLELFKDRLFSDNNTTPKILQPNHLNGLDGLRGIAIIFVLLGHSLIGTWWVDYLPGSIGVDIFFVLSGFLITTLLLKEKAKKGWVDLKKFYVRRALRIFPVAYLYLVSLIILTLVFHLHTTPRMFLTAGLYIGNFPIQYGSNWQTSHFWSLAVEEQFYLIFPILLVKSTNKYLLLVTLILLTLPFIVIVGRMPLGSNYQLAHKLILSFTYLLGYGTSSILIGSLTAILIFKGVIRVKKTSYLLSFILFVMAISVHITGVLNWNALIYVFPVLISAVIILNLAGDNFFSSILKHPILVKIGVLSYSIYIWQQLFTFSQPWSDWKYGNSLLINLPLLFLVSYSSYYFFERKFLTIKNRFKVL